eukprot:TRINITY_DN55644_c0_g1_i1.p1 TRINITY_DN55644_c0_g1~~TRINITY_DN55644_c0_g1_i1.p1  ORF type:complete len:948 (-),score=155.63 TRINITY_DN55644_c0_g1_i1:951-3794(-)
MIRTPLLLALLLLVGGVIVAVGVPLGGVCLSHLNATVATVRRESAAHVSTSISSSVNTLFTPAVSAFRILSGELDRAMLLDPFSFDSARVFLSLLATHANASIFGVGFGLENGAFFGIDPLPAGLPVSIEQSPRSFVFTRNTSSSRGRSATMGAQREDVRDRSRTRDGAAAASIAYTSATLKAVFVTDHLVSYAGGTQETFPANPFVRHHFHADAMGRILAYKQGGSYVLNARDWYRFCLDQAAAAHAANTSPFGTSAVIGFFSSGSLGATFVRPVPPLVPKISLFSPSSVRNDTAGGARGCGWLDVSLQGVEDVVREAVTAAAERSTDLRAVEITAFVAEAPGDATSLLVAAHRIVGGSADVGSLFRVPSASGVAAPRRVGDLADVVTSAEALRQGLPSGPFRVGDRFGHRAYIAAEGLPFTWVVQVEVSVGLPPTGRVFGSVIGSVAAASLLLVSGVGLLAAIALRRIASALRRMAKLEVDLGGRPSDGNPSGAGADGEAPPRRGQAWVAQWKRTTAAAGRIVSEVVAVADAATTLEARLAATLPFVPDAVRPALLALEEEREVVEDDDSAPGSVRSANATTPPVTNEPSAGRGATRSVAMPRCARGERSRRGRGLKSAAGAASPVYGDGDKLNATPRTIAVVAVTGPPQPAAVALLMQAVRRAASRHSGSVLHAVGGTVYITFNGAARCVRPHVSAVRAVVELIGVGSRNEGEPFLGGIGAVLRHNAVCSAAGCSDFRQVTVFGPALEEARALAAACAPVRQAALIDDALALAAASSVVTAPVCVVSATGIESLVGAAVGPLVDSAEADDSVWSIAGRREDAVRRAQHVASVLWSLLERPPKASDVAPLLKAVEDCISTPPLHLQEWLGGSYLYVRQHVMGEAVPRALVALTCAGDGRTPTEVTRSDASDLSSLAHSTGDITVELGVSTHSFHEEQPLGSPGLR